MLPIATYAMASEARDGLLDDAIVTPMCVSDDRRAGDYYRRTADGRFLLYSVGMDGVDDGGDGMFDIVWRYSPGP